MKLSIIAHLTFLLLFVNQLSAQSSETLNIPYDTLKLKQISQEIVKILNYDIWTFRIGTLNKKSTCLNNICFYTAELESCISIRDTFILVFPLTMYNDDEKVKTKTIRNINLKNVDYWIEDVEYVGFPETRFKKLHLGSLKIDESKRFYKLSHEKKLIKYIECSNQTEKLDSLIKQLKNILKDKYEADIKLRLEIFEKDALTYKTTNKEITITEEQRKYIVQANAMTDDKKYREAYQYFEKVIEINTVSYPQAYFNMALLASQFTDFSLAIFNMKKYLILVPDAPDARAAQDKIYEWELKINK